MIEIVSQWIVGFSAVHPLMAMAGPFALGLVFGFWIRAKTSRKPKKD